MWQSSAKAGVVAAAATAATIARRLSIAGAVILLFIAFLPLLGWFNPAPKIPCRRVARKYFPVLTQAR